MIFDEKVVHLGGTSPYASTCEIPPPPGLILGLGFVVGGNGGCKWQRRGWEEAMDTIKVCQMPEHLKAVAYILT